MPAREKASDWLHPRHPILPGKTAELDESYRFRRWPLPARFMGQLIDSGSCSEGGLRCHAAQLIIMNKQKQEDTDATDNS
jgi:hypothetical protein